MPDEKEVRGDDTRIVRGTEDGNDFRVMPDDEYRRVMRYVVRLGVVMLMSFDGDAKRRCEGFKCVIRASDAIESGIEVIEVTAYSIRRIALGIDADEENFRWFDAALAQVIAGSRQRLQRDRADVGTISEAEEQESDAIFQMRRCKWLPLGIDEADVREFEKPREYCRNLRLRQILTEIGHPDGRARQHHECDNENSEHGSDHAPDYLIRSIIRGP